MKNLIAYKDGKIIYSRGLIENSGHNVGIDGAIVGSRGIYLMTTHNSYKAIEEFELDKWGDSTFPRDAPLFFLVTKRGISMFFQSMPDAPKDNVSSVQLQATGPGEWIWTENDSLKHQFRAALKIKGDLREALKLVSKVTPLDPREFSVIQLDDLLENLKSEERKFWNEAIQPSPKASPRRRRHKS